MLQSHPKHHIRNWIQHICPPDAQLTPTTLAHSLCNSLSQGQLEIKELWAKNEYFYDSLIELSQQILCYVYSFSSRLRVFFPKCFTGYYELTKNIIHHQHGGQYEIPRELKDLLQQRMVRILFVDYPFSLLKHSLCKVSFSMLTENFMQEISSFLSVRISHFQSLYSLKIQPKAIANLVSSISGELQSKEQSVLEMPIDQILLCFCYASYKVNKEKVLFAKIISKYEKEFNVNINKGELLRFYNEVFILQEMFSINVAAVKIDRSGCQEKFIGSAIMEEKSILELFQ